LDVAIQHPYDPYSYLNVHKDGWEKRLGQTTFRPPAENSRGSK